MNFIKDFWYSILISTKFRNLIMWLTVTLDNNTFFTFNNNSLNKSVAFFYYLNNFIRLGNINRFHILREEILNNLPKVKVHPDDLYIYIRGGDVFEIINKPGLGYAQPPLCFYRNILNKFRFRKIRIISQDKFNPVLAYLEQFYNAKFIKNDIKLDISYLANSYKFIQLIV